MNGAESLVQTLVNCGVEVCFTNPGTSEMHFVAALDEVEGMRCVLGLFEGVLSGAADGYARIAGKPAATLLHLGPGLSNSLSNVHNARKAKVPMINIVGDHATYHLQFDAPLTSDIEGIAGAVSHWVHTSTSPQQLSADAARAAHIAHHGQIATLILPADVSWSEEAAAPVAPLPAVAPRSVSNETIIGAANRLSSNASSMILVGGHVDERIALQLGKIAKHTGARICVETFPTRLARGAGTVALEKLPYFAEVAIKFLAEVEHLILVGAAAPVSFFAYPNVPSQMHAAGCEIFTLSENGDDVHGCLDALIAELGAAEQVAEKAAALPPPLPTGELNAVTLGQSIGHQLPAGTIIVDDGATSGIPVYMGTANAPAHDWLALTGGAIGFGLPCSIGAAIAAPGRKVLCLVGDGSAMYMNQALWTMAREQLDVTAVIFNNGKYNILEIEFARTGARGGKPGPKAAAMLDIGSPTLNFTQMAQGMGVAATRATTAEEFNEQFAAAMQQRGPRLIEAMIPPVSMG